ncbi:SRX-1 protein [Aphelenchoides avenae]|nr:SRX-1 protein [Aphelenchus avenae]
MFTTWYQAEITEIVMALNRLTVIIFPEWRFLFHRQNVLVMVVVIFVTSAILSITAEILMPCCTLYIYYYVFGFKYFGVGSYNYSVAYITTPLNVASSAISLVCYTTIFVFVRRLNRSAAVGNGKRAKEVKYAIQFAMLTVFTLIEWLVMRLFPPLVPPEYPEVYSVVIFADIIRCSANSLIFITMNHELKANMWQRSADWQ